MTFFICGVLLGGALFFSRDANELVLVPIQRLITRMEMIRENPMAAMHFGNQDEARKMREENEISARENEPPQGRLAKLCPCCVKRKKKKRHEPMETQILE